MRQVHHGGELPPRLPEDAHATLLERLRGRVRVQRRVVYREHGELFQPMEYRRDNLQLTHINKCVCVCVSDEANITVPESDPFRVPLLRSRSGGGGPEPYWPPYAATAREPSTPLAEKECHSLHSQLSY